MSVRTSDNPLSSYSQPIFLHPNDAEKEENESDLSRDGASQVSYNLRPYLKNEPIDEDSKSRRSYRYKKVKVHKKLEFKTVQKGIIPVPEVISSVN